MAVQDYKINYKSDFVLNINGDAGWATQFCIKFWTGMPSQAYFVGFDGLKYVNCRVGDTPTQLLVMFDDHHLPIGKLMMQIAYHTTIEEFPGSVFDEVTNARDVIVTIDGTDYQVMLDFTGEDSPELEFNLPAYANEAERIQNELQRQQNEADRIAAELQREQATAAAVQGAEKVNAQLNGTTLTVTNRNGVSTSVNTKGAQGEQGPVGPEGPQGETGISIVSFTPKSETSTTLIYTITYSNGYTQDVAIPKGPKGDTGATGLTGPQGPQGDTGVSITGFVETGETETATLYNITFSNGTTQQVAIPKGEKGDQGPVGPQGPQGPMGDVAVITPEQQAAFTMYSETGQNTNGPMTQKAVTDSLVASAISYVNSQSGLAAENVQVALDEVADASLYYDKMDFGACTYPKSIITGSNVWATYQNASSIMIPVTPGQSIKCVGSRSSFYTCLTTMSITLGSNPSYAEGYTNRVPINSGETINIIVPSNGEALWFMRTNAIGTSVMPSLYTSETLNDVIEETHVYDNSIVDLSKCAESHRSIKSNNVWGTTSNDAFSILLPVSEGEVYTMISEQSNVIYAFLTDSDINAVNNDTVSFVSGYASRITFYPNSKKSITIPSTCKYLYFTSKLGNNNYLPKLYKQELSNIREDNTALYNINNSTHGLDLSLYRIYDRIIDSNNQWYMDNSIHFMSIMLPVKENDKYTVIATNEGPTYYAFLTATNNSVSSGDTPSYVTGYEERYLVPDNASKTFTIPVGCKFLFLLVSYHPKVFVNNAVLSLADAKKSAEENYSLVYYDEFDTINTDIWKAANFDSPSYASEFLADNKNWYADSSCMVLKLEKRGNKYYGPYISTAKTFAINKGKIEVKVKCNVVNTNLGWCFWTFGQNGNWPDTLEIDLFEKITGNATQYVHYHYKGTDNAEKDLTPTSVSNTEFGTDWHVLAVEWDSDTIITYFDGAKKSNTTINDSKYPFTFPQQLCFNVKCNSSYNAGDAYLFVDYVKVWVDKESSPITGFEQEDMEISVGETAFINPGFVPENCINKAFSLTSSDESIVSVQEFSGNDGGYENHYLMRKITGVSAGTATLTMTAANGATTKTFNVTVS